MARRKKEAAGVTPVVSFRLSEDVLERLDAMVERLKEENPWHPIGRTDVVRKLLLEGLEREERRK